MLSSPQDGNTYFQAGMYNDAAAKYKKVSRVKGTCDGGVMWGCDVGVMGVCRSWM